MHLGIGIDVVLVARVERLVRDRGDHFLGRWFTPEEIAACRAATHPERHVAERLAGKEATFKALRVDSDRPVPWRDLAILEGAHGGLTVHLFGDLSALASGLGVEDIHAAITHCEDYAMATVIISGGARA